jgi:hypothetical protein
MNCITANKIPITHILRNIYQCEPSEIRGNEVKYKAPSRNEHTASLFVNREMNVWKDFGNGKGGKAIDLVCELSGVSVAGALLILSGVQPASIDFSSFSQPNHEPEFKLSHVQPLQNRVLIQYLESRKIPYQIAANVPQLKEAYWKYQDKKTLEIRNNFALAFENDLGGFELRNKYFKAGTSPKTITTIPGSGTGLNLFEGFFYYLAASTFFPKRSENTTIVLNSLVNLEKVDLTRYQKINLFLDNDPAGITAATEIMQVHAGAFNRSQQFYKHYKDFNKYLLTI